MTNASGPIYEVTISVDHEIIDQFDAWLEHHVEEMLQIPGIVRAEVFEQEGDDQGRVRRITHYYFASDADLERYLSEQAETMRQSVIDRFDDQFDAVRRVLRHAEVVAGTHKPFDVCLNCGTTLGGQYCGNCGQRAASRLISVWELFRDAFGDLLDLDSRLWRTLVPLITRPGKLTRDYLEGRRARFMPPFRTYLVLSIFFFLIAFFDPREELGILFEPEPPSTADSEENAVDTDAVRDEIIRELTEEGIIIGESGDAEAISEEETEADSGNLSASFSPEGEPSEDCDVDDIDSVELPAWLKSRLTKERLKVVCDRIIADDGRAFLKKLLDNVPAALFVLLPLMALVLKVLYPLSKRYYVEHLLFVLHYHAFFFLIMTLQVLFSRLGALIGVADAADGASTFAVILYIPVYLYKALRRVYGQGRLFSILKFLMLVFSYFAGLLVIFGLVALFAAFSI